MIYRNKKNNKICGFETKNGKQKIKKQKETILKSSACCNRQ
jgi:hypothetical protein